MLGIFCTLNWQMCTEYPLCWKHDAPCWGSLVNKANVIYAFRELMIKWRRTDVLEQYQETESSMGPGTVSVSHCWIMKSTSVKSRSIFAHWKWNEWMHLGQFLFIFNILIHLKLAQATSEISLFSSFQQIVGIKRTVNYSPVLVQLSLLDWLKTSSL